MASYNYNLPGMPGGAYTLNGGNQVFLNGQPYTGDPGGQNVFYNSSTGTYTYGNPPAAPAPTQEFPLQAQGGYAPPVVTQTQAPTPSGPYTPPQVNALKDIATIDPGTSALMTGLPQQYSQVGSDYFNQLTNAENGVLPPGVQREIQQDVRGNQAAIGNSQGVAQAAEEGMTTGTAGLQYLQSALQQAQGYLGNTSGYVQGGATPYAMGTGYVNNALNQQAAALTGSPVYAPATTGVNPYMYLNPNAGNEFSQNTVGFMNAGTGASAGSPNTAGPLIGSAISAIGSVLGGLAMCWVAREVLGTSNDDWKIFREWMLTEAPEDFRAAYMKSGAALALWIQDRPDIKDRLRPFMRAIVRGFHATKNSVVVH